MKLGGVDEPHAAFLNESRTRCRSLVPGTGNPGISLVFREMWDTTALSLRLSVQLLYADLEKSTAHELARLETQQKAVS